MSERNKIINKVYDDIINEPVNKLNKFIKDKNALICGWPNKYSQYKRFEILLNIGVKNNDKLLDIGCANGELIEYLKENNIKVKYVGIDLNQNYLQIAKKRFPENIFELSEICNFTCNEKFEWAIASGAFSVDCNITIIKWYIKYIMENLVSKGFAFNLLNKLHSKISMKTPIRPIITFNQNYIYKELINSFPQYKIRIIKNYLKDIDFTIYIKHENNSINNN